MAETTLYYRTAGGLLTSRVISGEDVETPRVPEGATVLTEAEYAEALAAVQAERAAYAQQLTETDQANQEADYSALIAAGVPDSTARRLTGYTGPNIEPESGGSTPAQA
jgi:hypothetical protein